MSERDPTDEAWYDEELARSSGLRSRRLKVAVFSLSAAMGGLGGVLYAPVPGTDVQLKTLVARLLERPLDRKRPLWEMWFIEGLPDGRYARGA